MCTSIVEIANATGMAKRNEDWFELTHSVVSYDHARYALLDEAITLDFVNTDLPAGARAAVELSLETAKELRDALDRAIAAADLEEAERAEALGFRQSSAVDANVVPLHSAARVSNVRD